MQIRATFASLLIALVVAGCVSTSENELTAYIDIAAPKHYPVWVEALELEDSDVRHWRMPVGYVRCCWNGPNGPRGSGGRMEPFPDYIGIRWFSFAEQKFYERLFSLPEGLKAKMRKRISYTTSLGTFSKPRNFLVVGVAPGGQMVLWINRRIGDEIEVGRLQANEVEGDASNYEVGTRHYLEENGNYIEKHGVPTEGW